MGTRRTSPTPGVRRVVVLAAAAALATGLTVGPPASAQNNPFGPAPQVAPQAPTAPTATTASSSGGGLGTSAQVLLFVAGGLLLGLIGWLILRDARAAAPRAEHLHAPRTGSARRPDRERARAKAKAARQQRRRNRG